MSRDGTSSEWDGISPDGQWAWVDGNGHHNPAPFLPGGRFYVSPETPDPPVIHDEADRIITRLRWDEYLRQKRAFDDAFGATSESESASADSAPPKRSWWRRLFGGP